LQVNRNRPKKAGSTRTLQPAEDVDGLENENDEDSSIDLEEDEDELDENDF
jgi:hypothetical protein